MPSNYQFELNSSMKWDFMNPLPSGVPLWVLAEEDTCDPLKYPSVFRAIFNENGEPGTQLKLLDFDPETEEECLSGNMWNVVAWRHMTDHGGTYDNLMRDKGVTFLSNWITSLKD